MFISLTVIINHADIVVPLKSYYVLCIICRHFL